VAGLEIQKAYQLAVKDIEAEGLLGKSKIELSFEDTGGKAPVGASLASAAVTKDYPIVFGSPVGGIALAEAPIFARAKQPTIFSEAGSDGVIASDHIFRMTPTIPSYYHKTLEYLKSKGTKKLAVVTNTDQPTLASMAKQAQDQAGKYGYAVSSYDELISTQADVSATVTKMLAPHPDAVALLVQTGQNATFVKALRDAGYTGLITSSTSAGGGVLKSIGETGNGVVWATNYTHQQPGERNKKFVAEFQAAYNSLPTNWAAAAYDAMYFAAHSLKEADSVDKEKVVSAMKKVGTEGFDGVRGKVTVKDGQQEATSSTMVMWQDGDTAPV
jgi:branched-chain amino acid transport system substrate-binding protein